jgi:hypothetical protein
MSFLFENTDEKFEKMYEEHLLSKKKIKVDEKSSFKDKKEREEYEEYQRLLKEKKLMEETSKRLKEEREKRLKPYIEKRKRFDYLEKKFNPENVYSVYDDKPDIFQKVKEENEILKSFVKPKNKILTEDKIITLKKQNPKISLEEAILRTFGPTRDIYEDEEIIKLFKLEKYPPNAPPLPSSPKRSSPKKSKSNLTKESLEMAKSKLKPKSPPKPPPLPSPPKRYSPKKSKSILTKEELEMAKSKLKPKGPPYPPPLPSSPVQRSSPKRSSPKKSKLTKEELEIAKSKLKHSQKNLKPDDPNYYLEMAFRNLEK